MAPEPPKIFVSYSHDSPEHADRVLKLANRLCADGFDAVLDQYEVSPPEGWPLWMDKHIRDADFTLMVCTETYYKRVMGEEEPGKGLGVRWEGSLIYNRLYVQGALNTRFIPTLFDAADHAYIPTPVQGATFYAVHTEDGYKGLLNRLEGRASAQRPPLGSRRRETDFFQPWNVPYPRNPFFTGREEVLSALHNALTNDSAAALTQTQAISGLGGVGKTQTAIEYAYRHRKDYAAVFWTRADTKEALHSGFVEIAQLLELPERSEQDQNVIVKAIRRWLQTNPGWLLIADNADDSALVKDALPPGAQGRVLLTSRAQNFDALGIANAIELNEMTPEEALAFLFKRTGRADNNLAERQAAKELAQKLGWLPLALEQAAAYIKAKQTRFQDYLAAYRKRHLELLEKQKPVAGDYPATVRTTWQMNFDAVRQESPASAEILSLSAFLAPDRIPHEILIEGASELGPVLSKALKDGASDPLILDELLEPLTRYSLIRRNVEARTYDIHLLVQAVIQEDMWRDWRRTWAERTVKATYRAFPEAELTDWIASDRVLSQALACVKLIDKYAIRLSQAWRLLNNVGYYMSEVARYAEAELLLKQSIILP